MDKTFFMDEMKAALKAGDKVKLGVVRFLMSEIKNAEIDAPEALTEADIVQLIKRQVKQTKETMDGFLTAGREDMVEAEAAKLAILNTYMPAEMSDADLQTLVKRVIESIDAPSMGQVMKAVMSETQGTVDGGRVSAVVRELL